MMMMMLNGAGGGDNISIGKRSTTSSDYNQPIYDENDGRSVTSLNFSDPVL